MRCVWILIVTTAFLLGGCEKARLDEEVKRLCAKDGGIKAYETVKLPPEKFNQWGQPNFYDPTQGENALGPEYSYKFDIHYYRTGNPQMSRYHIQVIRRSDGKLLGEAISYGRGGGDVPSPMHDSTFSCPSSNEASEIALFKQIFPMPSKERK
jgi:hypothetical protein